VFTRSVWSEWDFVRSVRVVRKVVAMVFAGS
jgi:hypothetical protein